MKISTKGRYGLEAMVGMALIASDRVVKIGEISEFCNISEAYLTQIFVILRRAGIIDSVRGPQGGYALVDSPDRITAGSIVKILEGSLYPDVMDDGGQTEFDLSSAKWFWNGIGRTLTDVLDGITLQDLVDQYREMKDDDSTIEYFI